MHLIARCAGQYIPGTETKYGKKKACKASAELYRQLLRAQLHTLPISVQTVLSDWLDLNRTLDEKIGRHYFNGYASLTQDLYQNFLQPNK
jgi:hypothetical protein